MDFRFAGLCVATVTPFDTDGGLRLEAVGPLAAHLLKSGVRGLYVCGSTGEGVSLTSAERMAVAEAYVEAVDHRVPVIIQVGHNSLTAARELAAHAQSIGAEAISATCPSYFKIESLDVLVESMAYIAASAADVPFYYYHIPSLTGVDFDMPDFLRRAARRSENLVGVKFSSPELHHFQRCLELEDGRFDVLWGVDEMLLGALATGARGAIGSTYNIATPVYLRLIDAFQRGDLQDARRWQARAVRLIAILSSYPFHSALRAALRLQGFDCGPSRLPQRALTADEAADLKTSLEAIGFFEWSEASGD